MNRGSIRLLGIGLGAEDLSQLSIAGIGLMPELSVQTALTGSQGLQLARSEDPDVIILGVPLADMDACSVCRALKAEKQLLEIPVLFLTADRETRMRALEAGADGFLPEPLDGLELLPQLRAMAKVKLANRGGIHPEDPGEAPKPAPGTVLPVPISRSAEEALSASEQRFRGTLDAMMEGCQIVGFDWRYRYVNAAAVRQGHSSVEALLGRTMMEAYPGIESTAMFTRLKRCMEDRAPQQLENEFLFPDGSGGWFQLLVHPVPDGIFILSQDISERKLQEKYLEMRRAVLQELNRQETLQVSIQRVVGVLKAHTGFEAVGIRLETGEDFPYFAQEGFPKSFLLSENSLLERSPGGAVCRDEDGKVCLECTCGLVISGKTDPASPLFTKGGSSWTNDSFPFLHVPASEDPRIKPRNTCIHRGYASIALAPIRCGDRILGLIQLNDGRKGRLTLELVTHLERLAEDIGTAVVRRRAEEALRASRDQIELLLQSTGEGIYGIDAQGRCTFINRSALRALGFAMRECISEHLHALTHHGRPDGSPYAVEECPISRTTVSGEGSRVDNDVFWRKDGTAFPVEYSSFPVVEGGETRGAVVAFSDITRRRRTEAALRESESRFRRLFETMAQGVIYRTKDGGITSANRAAEEILGMSLDQMLGRTSLNSCRTAIREDGSDFPENGHPCTVALRTGQAVRGVVMGLFNPTQNRYRWVLVNAIPDFAPGETVPLQVYTTLTDITDRRDAEDALRSAKAALEEAQNLVLMGSAERNLATGEVMISPQFYSILERDPATVSGSLEELLEIVHPDDRAAVSKVHAEPLDNSDLVEIDHRIVTPDGRVKWVKTRRRTELDGDGKPVRRLATIQDITEHRLALEAENLARARDAAETANRAKSAFLANMSHEIRTPMNAILGFTQLLLGEKGLSPSQRDHIGAINRAGEHLLHLINDTLELSRIEAGRVSVNLASTDLGNLIWDLESMFRLRMQEKGLGFRIERSPDLPRSVVTDDKKLRQILINLLGNALKFTRKGGIGLRLRVEGDTGLGFSLVAAVHDSGPGIAGEEMPRLFREFQQTRSGRDAGGGSGLGLAISRGFARLMGGDITVESLVGEGSVFTLSLPVTISEPEAVSRKVAAPRIARLRPEETRRKVLVADDVASNREILLGILGRVGFEVLTADDGREAVALFSSWQPDLVLMDLRMPGMDGTEAIRTIRRIEKGARVPIVAVTASAFDENRQEVTDAGGDDFISKPFREYELLETIGRCLGVGYIFEESAEDAPPVTAGTVPIPVALRKALLAAIVSADLDEILSLSDEMAVEDLDGARVIRELAGGFEYDRLRTYVVSRE